MQVGWIKKSLCVLCLGLPGVLVAVALAQSQTPSILDRVQKVDDPQLAELVRVGMESRENLGQKERLEIIRKVTLSYVQIKLLDQQVAEVSRKIEAETGPAEMRYELLLAKTELESKLMTELANLREIMGIVPKHAFEEQPIETLNTWLNLNVIGERVYVLDALKPFKEYWAKRRWKSAGLLSERETLDYIRERLQSNSSLPLRIDIDHTPSNTAAAEDLHGKILSLARETNAQMETEVRTELMSTFAGSGESTFFLRQGQIRTCYPTAVQRPDGGPRPLVTGLVNPNELEQHILWRLTRAKNVPLTFRIEYDEASALTAKQVAETVKAVAKRLGIAELVEVVEALVEPVPEAAFLGRWQGVADTEIREIELQAGGQSRLTMRTGRTGQTTQPAPWTLTTNEIFIESAPLVTWRGYLNAEGNLVINRGQIYLQGSWSGGPPEMVFKKVEEGGATPEPGKTVHLGIAEEEKQSRQWLVTKEEAKDSGSVYAWSRIDRYIPPDFNGFFSDDPKAAHLLDELFSSLQDSNLPDNELLQIVRNGLRRTSQDRELVLRAIGNRYIWNKTPQNPAAIEIMYHAADPGNVYGTRHYAIYFGLSVIRPENPPNVLRTLVSIRMKVDDENDIGRVTWGCQNQLEGLRSYLAPYLDSPDDSIRQKAIQLDTRWKGKAS